MTCITLLDCPYKISLCHIFLDSSEAPIGEFTHLFISLPHLETIEVYQNIALVLFKALDTITGTTEDASLSTPLPFPKLHTVI